MLINNPIIGVNGKGVLENNKLNIENFKGSSINTRDNNFEKIRENISAKGSIDFSKFFKPSYDLMVSSIDNKYIYLVRNNRLIQHKISIISEENDGVLIEDNNLSGNYIATTRLSNMQDNMQVKTITK